jgi:hypothetical protein
LIYPHRHQIVPLPPSPGVEREPLADREHAVAWFAGQYAALVAAVDLAAQDALEMLEALGNPDAEGVRVGLCRP